MLAAVAVVSVVLIDALPPDMMFRIKSDRISGPMQQFAITRNAFKAIVMVVGGTGITPAIQLIKQVLNDRDDTVSTRASHVPSRGPSRAPRSGTLQGSHRTCDNSIRQTVAKQIPKIRRLTRK